MADEFEMHDTTDWKPIPGASPCPRCGGLKFLSTKNPKVVECDNCGLEKTIPRQGPRTEGKEGQGSK